MTTMCYRKGSGYWCLVSKHKANILHQALSVNLSPLMRSSYPPSCQESQPLPATSLFGSLFFFRYPPNDSDDYSFFSTWRLNSVKSSSDMDIGYVCSWAGYARLFTSSRYA